MSVVVSSLSKHFGSVRAIDDLSIEFREGAISVLLGASGCGKTTTLRCIAGLEQPTSGQISIGGQTVFASARGIDLPPERRDLGMVFQSYAIWPHMTVLENVALPLRAKKRPAAEVAERARATLTSVGLGQQIDRGATQLSGGQQQRVSIARCLVADPRLILMDEPLSNLDAKLRVEMRHEIRQLQRRLGATILFVTHDQEEAMSLADEIILFDKGKIVQRGAPEELYFRPQVRYVADFLGKANLLPVTARPTAGGLEVVADGGHVLASGQVSGIDGGGRALAMVRPEAWRIGPVDAEGLTGRVEETTFIGDRRELLVQTPIGRLTVMTLGMRSFGTGEGLSLTVEPEYLHLIAEAA
ncbi:iron(III) transport system ATP-binding protein [Bosea sp. AK1]|uniref:ABC transporter ATP-binding protein n=1 Tax=Bosea sp. AK1 TaxID=2587160 RepID=UPI00114D94CA|nr:ABC transporter ATP-binding protein [Bosea sp. AK1]TQI73982.1 iron(III) transport system ATP-binding protein [Bosea sp. AK1]